METIQTPEFEDFCEDLTDAQEDLVRDLLSRIAAKWPLWVLYVLAENGAPCGSPACWSGWRASARKC